MAAVILAGAGVVAAVAHDGDDDRPVNETVLGDDGTTTTSFPESTTSTTASPGATTTSSPPTTAAGSSTTARPTTTVRPGTTTTRRAAVTTTAPLQLCQAEQIDISAAPESLSYPAGQPVTMRTTLRNRSTTPCFYRGYSVTLRFLDRNKGQITSSAVNVPADVDRTFAPGQSLTHTATWTPATPPPPGIYQVEATWSFSGGRYGATQDYVLR